MFYSILFPNKERHKDPRMTEMPDYFKDLNLDQVILSVTQRRSDFGLEPFFFTPLRDIDTIVYRQEIMRDLDAPELLTRIKLFAKTIYDIQRGMAEMQKHLLNADSYHNNYLTRGRYLNAAERYCNAVSSFIEETNPNTLNSRGLKSFWEYMSSYGTSDAFLALTAYIKKLRVNLATVKYCMLIRNDNIRVRKYEQQEDHSKQIPEIFDKFKQSATKDYRHTFREEPHAEHVEAAVLDMVARWYKDVFEDLNRFCAQHMDFVDNTIARFAHEVQFYIAWHEYIGSFRRVGLSFCYPKICTTKEHIYSLGGFDLALARSLLSHGTVVTNDFSLDTPERAIVITGPNQGGKTTFARTFGQLHHLACIGCCVPGTDAALFLFDHIYTHFGREEDLSTLSGNLQDDLIRLHRVFENASEDSIIIINEIFSSAALQDALLLAKRMMDKVVSLGALAVCVTFLDELASHSAETVSMMSTVRQDDPTQRTYKIVRQSADGLAYAIHIAEKHGLTYESLCRRLQA